MDEIWKPIKGFEGRYEVSSFGRIKALSRPLVYKDGRKGVLKEQILRGSIMKIGYRLVCLDSKHRLLVHRLVANAFIENTHDKRTVNHKDGNKLNNHVSNLEWATFKENNDHSRETKLNNQHGEKTNLTKYTDQFIDAIRNVYQKYSPSYEDLGKIFGITGCHARQIVLFQTRKKPTIIS
jgi:hypothetical protein